MKARWLDNALILSPIWCTLVTSEEMYFAECKRLGISAADHGEWLLPNADATASHFVARGKRITIISIEVDPDLDPIKVAGMLVHEAVHVWQRTCREIGEESPSKEFEAYSIQRISQQLMREYVRQTQSA